MADQVSRPIVPTPTSYASAPLLWIDWACQWLAYLAGNLAVFRVLEYAGKLTVLIALIAWIADYPERQRTAIRGAWSVVNAKGGGRKDSLEYLAARQVDLKGLFGGGGDFTGIGLKGRDLRWSDLEDANFEDAKLDGVNPQGSRLSGASFKNASLAHSSFRYSRLHPKVPNFEDADIDGADFRDITVLDAGVYRTLATAHNWQSALFDENTHRMVECMATSGAAPPGCGSVPEIQQDPSALGHAVLTVQAIVQSVHCEMGNALKDVRKYDLETAKKFHQKANTDFLLRWGTEMTLTLTIYPNLSGTADATRTDRASFYYLIPTLLDKPYCATGVQQGDENSPLVQSDLKLMEWLQDYLSAISAKEGQQPIAENGALKDTVLSHNIKFTITTSGNIKTLTRATVNPTSTDRTHDLTITLGPGSPTGFVGHAAPAASAANQIGNAVATSIHFR
jgi:Pentapeptide repeats (8 copies)